MQYQKYKFGYFVTSNQEIADLTIAWFAISLAFAIAYSRGLYYTVEFLLTLTVAAITVGTAFIFHEMGHKLTAQRFGCFAEFRASMSMLMIAVLMSFSGIIFAAPGAVMISGYVNNITNGKISASGPLVNLMLAALFLLLAIFVPVSSEFVMMIFSYGFLINTWLALFNMIPVSIFDGAKIYKWNKNVYGGMVIVGLIFLLF